MGGPQTGFWYYAGAGGWVFIEPGAGDNLGNHPATQHLNLTDKLLVGGTAATPGTQGLRLDAAGNVSIGLGPTVTPTEQLEVGGNVKITGTAGTDRLIFPDGTKQTTAAGGGRLTLPYSGTASNSGSVFRITNSSSGIGPRHWHRRRTGVVGVKDTAASTLQSTAGSGC